MSEPSMEVPTLQQKAEDSIRRQIKLAKAGGKDKDEPVLLHAKDYHDFTAEELDGIRSSLLTWYDREQRELPWRAASARKEGDTIVPIARSAMSDEEEGQRAYEVWVSEIMLQQTQVSTVINYYKKWMEKWPTIFDLAKADLETVNQVWSGLGYYSRAKRMLDAAKLVVNDYKGKLPKDVLELEKKIPGIGPYTAGAVASIAYNIPAPLVDGNVVRVASRLRALAIDPKSKPAIELHWKLAKNILDETRPGDFNQALMDLGATVCTPQQPSCGKCPISQYCLAYAEEKAHKRVAAMALISAKKTAEIPDLEDGCDMCRDADLEDFAVSRYPPKVKKTKQKIEECVVAIVECTVQDKPSYLVMQTKSKGLLANLWDFPNVIARETADEEEDESELSKDTRRKLIDNHLKLFLNITLVSKETSESVKENLESSNIVASVLERRDLGDVAHIFSHIRRLMHVEYLKITTSNGQLPKLPEDRTTCFNSEQKGKQKGKKAGKKPAGDIVKSKWMDLDEMENGAVPITLRKAMKLLKEGGGGVVKKFTKKTISKASTPAKRKRASKREKLIDDDDEEEAELEEEEEEEEMEETDSEDSGDENNIVDDDDDDDDDDDIPVNDEEDEDYQMDEVNSKGTSKAKKNNIQRVSASKKAKVT
ncbi:hypothetical protein HDU97_001245 [Phlyctochytrium planicorne]|nr:hypothetical protein HDU97_001245 [Phlyctochytrium planicorne]